MMLCSCSAGVAYFCSLFRNWCLEIFMGSSRLSLLPFLSHINSCLTDLWVILFATLLEDFYYYYYSYYYFVPFILFVLLGWLAAAMKQQLLEDLTIDFLCCVILGKTADSQPVQVRAILYNFMGSCQSISHCWKVLGVFVCLFLPKTLL